MLCLRCAPKVSALALRLRLAPLDWLLATFLVPLAALADLA
jgi:hypothetical protein